ncbi:aminotransferase class I/II-fold pyridoxal phosphate-dependent enzyme, partial [Rhizobium leguminosarum]|uniref:aminotransferase class I/II-fold pyridoxal phosphate-dependent enzyme n=1 Tax=Rhizobium leguminosarum TaxID=384 RepID=UPI003F9E5543
SRSNKIDLGVGVYRDASGTTPIPRSVREAEKRIHAAQATKAYVCPAGDPVFCDLVGRRHYQIIEHGSLRSGELQAA